jgi:peroxiredoxin
MPELQKLAAPLREAGVEVLGLSLDMGKSIKKVPRFLQKLGIDYPVFTTDEQVFTDVFSGEEVFIPLSFIIDEQGRIADILTGWSPESEARIRRLLEP